MITNTDIKVAVTILYPAPNPSGYWLEKLLGPFYKKYSYGLQRMKATIL
jgi:hypothetical protein